MHRYRSDAIRAENDLWPNFVGESENAEIGLPVGSYEKGTWWHEGHYLFASGGSHCVFGGGPEIFKASVC